MSTLQVVRERKGFTRREVAARIGMTEKQLERWEKGKSPVKQLHLLALAKLYEVDVTDLTDEVAA